MMFFLGGEVLIMNVLRTNLHVEQMTIHRPSNCFNQTMLLNLSLCISSKKNALDLTAQIRIVVWKERKIRQNIFSTSPGGPIAATKKLRNIMHFT